MTYDPHGLGVEIGPHGPKAQIPDLTDGEEIMLLDEYVIQGWFTPAEAADAYFSASFRDPIPPIDPIEQTVWPNNP